MERPTIVSCGEVLWDLFPEGPRFGGAPANFACHAAVHGARVYIVSAVGDDERGRDAVKILAGYGIDVDLVQIVAGAKTGTVGIELDARGKPTFTIHEDSAWDQLAWGAQIESRVASADAVYFGTLGQRDARSRAVIGRAIDVAAAAGTPRILDVNLRPPFYDDGLICESIQRASILKLSDDELPEVCAACGVSVGDPVEEALHRLLDAFTLDCVAMTQGAEGATLVTAAERIRQPGIETTVRDTVGAGDSFTAALLLGMLRGEPLQDVLRQACTTAAEICAQTGAVPSPP